MKITLLLFLAMLLTVHTNGQEADGKVRVFVSWPGGSYPPGYTWEKGDAKPTGIEPKLIERILEIAGYEYVFIDDYEHWGAGDVRLDVITDRRADISIRSITITEDRKQLVNFSDPYYFDGVGAVVHADSNIGSKDDFPNKKIFVYKFTTAYNWARDNLEETEIVTDRDFTGNLIPEQLFLKGKIDAYLGDKTYLRTLLHESPKLKLLDESYTREPFGIAVDKHQPQLLKDINQALEKLRSTGELEEITAGFME